MYKYTIFGLMIALFVSACVNNASEQSAYAELGETSEPTREVWTILPDSHYVLSLFDGGEIYVPPNSFIDEQGNSIQVTLTIEAYDGLLEMLSANLSTRSTLGLLETKGMFSIDAQTSDNRAVKIDPKNPLAFTHVSKNDPYKTYPEASSKGEPFKLYPGVQTDSGVIWGEGNDALKFKTIPVEACLYWMEDAYETFSCKEQGHGNIVSTFLENFDYSIESKPVISNLAYIVRWRMISMSIFSSFHPDIYTSKGSDVYFSDTCRTPEYIEFEKKIANYALKYLDSLPVEELTLEKFDEYILKRLEKEFLIIKEKAKKGHFDFYDKSKIKFFKEYKKRFCQQWKYDFFDYSTTKPLDAASIEVLRKGIGMSQRTLSEEKLVEYATYFRHLDQLEEVFGFWGEPSFCAPITELGWYNIDKLLDTNLEQQELIVKLNNEPKRSCHVSLLLKKQKVMLSELTGEMQCSFKAKLPKTSAIVIGLYSEKGQFFFAQKEIEIGQDKEVQLDFQPTSKEAIEKALQIIDGGYE